MNIRFEDEDEFPEGMEIFTEQVRAMGSVTSPIGTELSTSVALSGHTRAVSTQRATPSTRSLSPMDIDSGLERMQVDEEISHGPVIAATRVPPTSVMRAAVPFKRPTDMHDLPGPGSPPPSPSTMPQPAKRTQTGREPDFGGALEPFFIAHSALVQPLLDVTDLAWGTIYEIARGVTKGRWAWSSVTRERLQQLRGTNAHAAHRVAAVMLGREVPRAPAEDLWIEYDREQDAIMENKGRGLGGMGPWKGKENWYGGHIQQVGRLVRAHNQFLIQLEKPEIRRSHRFSRFLGSRRILQVRVADDLLHKDGKGVRFVLSSSKFILCGRVFLPFHAKEGSIYLVETNQDYERTASLDDGDQFRISLRDFTTWHNPLGLNSKQPISKWSTRWALGLSTSIPTIQFEPQYIYFIKDIEVSPKDWEGKTPAEKCLTDGCGFINGAALTQIMRVMGYSHRPTAVQGRIGGSKGMWVLHPEPLEQVADGPAKIWIRSSQTKIKLGEISRLGPAQMTFDLLAYSRVTTPSHLSSQTLINLAHNGIGHQLLKDLMSLGLKEEIQSFIDWNQPYSMILLWKAVEKAGKVIVGRLRRQFSGQARALGLGQLRPLENHSQEMEELEIKIKEETKEEDISHHMQSSSDLGQKPFPYQPQSLHESVLELLQVGFHPLQLDILFKKLETVISLVLDDYLERFHIPIMESCEAYIIPDPHGVLEEGQIHFKSSEPITNPITGEQTNIVLGDVLVSRNPTRLPSDIQKVKAVACSELSTYFDVIIFPIKGKYSLASFLGGGDYDGDTVMLNWCKPLVEQFKGSHFSKAPSNLSEFFERKVEYVRDFDERISQLPSKEAQQTFHEVLLLGLAETRVGLYSNFHDSAVYELGYGDLQAIHLAYMFTTCLDGSKTGLRVKLPVFFQDRKTWLSRKPWYKWRLEQRKSGKRATDNGSQKSPRKHNPPFILDVLVEEGDKLRKEALQHYKSLKGQDTNKEDQDLSGPWYAARDRATHAAASGFSGLKDNLDDINAHVEEAWKKYKRVLVITSSIPEDHKGTYYEGVTSLFAEPPPFKNFSFLSDDEIRILKASCASTKCLTFAFSVAFRDLCTIKSRASGNIPMSCQFAPLMAIPNVVVRTFSQVQGADM